MSIGLGRFNIYLCCCLVALSSGCRTNKDGPEKRLATLRLHMESIPDSTDFTTSVAVFRKNPVDITVAKSPFITEANVSEAKVVEEMGGFALEIQFDRRGTSLLELYTSSNPGKHIAIFSEFGLKTNRQARWLAAPYVPRRISTGRLTFTPDATREEADEIVLGLNNLARKLQEKSKW